MKGFSAEPGERSAVVMSIAPGALAAEIGRAADLGADLAGGVVDDEDGGREPGLERAARSASQRLEARLQAGVDG